MPDDTVSAETKPTDAQNTCDLESEPSTRSVASSSTMHTCQRPQPTSAEPSRPLQASPSRPAVPIRPNQDLTGTMGNIGDHGEPEDDVPDPSHHHHRQDLETAAPNQHTASDGDGTTAAAASFAAIPALRDALLAVAHASAHQLQTSHATQGTSTHPPQTATARGEASTTVKAPGQWTPSSAARALIVASALHAFPSTTVTTSRASQHHTETTSMDEASTPATHGASPVAMTKAEPHRPPESTAAAGGNSSGSGNIGPHRDTATPPAKLLTRTMTRSSTGARTSSAPPRHRDDAGYIFSARSLGRHGAGDDGTGSERGGGGDGDHDDADPDSPAAILAQGPLRKGKWTAEEEEYTACIIADFTKGLLPLDSGSTLRSYLSEKLNCDPMRITKKFAGASCIGKQVFQPCDRTTENMVLMQRSQRKLRDLEKAFVARLRGQQRPVGGGGVGGAGDNSASQSSRRSSSTVVASASASTTATTTTSASSPFTSASAHVSKARGGRGNDRSRGRTGNGSAKAPPGSFASDACVRMDDTGDVIMRDVLAPGTGKKRMRSGDYSRNSRSSNEKKQHVAASASSSSSSSSQQQQQVVVDYTEADRQAGNLLLGFLSTVRLHASDVRSNLEGHRRRKGTTMATVAAAASVTFLNSGYGRWSDAESDSTDESVGGKRQRLV